jgi:hypothetical protein
LDAVEGRPLLALTTAKPLAHAGSDSDAAVDVGYDTGDVPDTGQSSGGSASSDMNLRSTFSVMRDTLFSQLFSSSDPHQAMELDEKTPPPSLVVK